MFQVYHVQYTIDKITKLYMHYVTLVSMQDVFWGFTQLFYMVINLIL